MTESTTSVSALFCTENPSDWTDITRISLAMDRFSFIFVLSLVSSTRLTDATTNGNCALLEVAIENFIKGTEEYGNALYLQMEARDAFLDDEDLSDLKQITGYDLRIQKELQEFACKLAETNNRDDIAKVFGITRDNVDTLYNAVLQPMDGPGLYGLSGVLQVGQIMSTLLNWANRTGYPVLPFSIDTADTLNTFKKIQFNQRYSPAAQKYLTNVPFPLNISPQQAVKVLSDAESYDQLEKDMKIEIGSLKRYADWNKRNSRAVTDAIADVEATMNLLLALDKTLILYF